MMYCPKCGKRIDADKIKPNCPKCNEDLTGDNVDESFLTEAKKAQLHQAKANVLQAEIKYSFIGTPLHIIRFAAAVFGVMAFFISFGSFKFSLPLFDYEKVNLTIKSCFRILFSDLFPPVREGIASPSLFRIEEAVQGELRAAIILMLAAFVIAFFAFLFLSFSFRKKIQFVSSVLSLVGAGMSAAATALFWSFNNNITGLIPKEYFYSGSIGAGGFAAALLSLLAGVLGLIFFIRGSRAKQNKNDLALARLYEKIQKGELAYSDLDFPITAENVPHEKNKK